MTGKIRILIVEDEALVAEDLKEMLLGFGYEVPGIAYSGEEAIALADKHRPDLVLMDINLTGKMDGITAGEEIRSQGGIPIIFATAFANRMILERAKNTCPSGFIFKPYNEQQIQITIEIALFFKKIEQQLKERDETIRTLLNMTANPSLPLDTQGPGKSR
jgi:CheY-like chemotaxis protein